MDKKLTLRKGSAGDLLDKEAIYRTGREMKSNFYFVSAGMQGEVLVFSAFDKDREVKVELRLKRESVPSYEEVKAMVERLDVQTVSITLFGGGEQRQEVLVLKNDLVRVSNEMPLSAQSSRRQREVSKFSITCNLGNKRGQLPLMKQ